MAPETRVRVNGERAAAKIIDGEAIIIDVVTGRYYSLEDSGALVWELLASGASFEDVARGLEGRYEVERPRALADVERLVAELAEGELVVVESGNGASQAGAPPPSAVGERAPYRSPALTVFTDMEELLAFDPPLPAMDTDVWQAPEERQS